MEVNWKPFKLCMKNTESSAQFECKEVPKNTSIVGYYITLGFLVCIQIILLFSVIS